jgi:hypothetical protein
VFTVLGDSEAVLQVEAGATARHVLEVVRRAHVVVRLSEIPNEAELEELTLTHDFEVQTRRLHSAIEGTKGATEIAWTVAPGESVLSARWAASSWSWSRPLLLDLQPGETREVALVPLSVQVTWGGRVVDTAGQPVGGVVTSITVRDRGLTGHGHQALLDVLAEKRVSSADDGSWALSVPAGASTLAVDTTDGRGRYLAPYDVDTELRDPSRPIEIVVASACVVTAAIEAWPPKPPTGGESPRWTLRLRRQTGPFTWSNPREWQSRQLEGERSFTFSPMAAGRYELELSMAGRCAQRSTSTSRPVSGKATASASHWTSRASGGAAREVYGCVARSALLSAAPAGPPLSTTPYWKYQVEPIAPPGQCAHERLIVPAGLVNSMKLMSGGTVASTPPLKGAGLLCFEMNSTASLLGFALLNFKVPGEPGSSVPVPTSRGTPFVPASP